MIRRVFPLLAVACLAQMIFCGCSERPKTPAEYAESRVRLLINGLSCGSERSVRKSADIVTNLATIADNENVKGYYTVLIAKRRNAVMAALSESCRDAGLQECAEIVDEYR